MANLRLPRLRPVRSPRLVALVVLVLLASGCEVRTRVHLTADADGSGTVEVAVGLDGEALSRVPDLDGDGTSGSADLRALVRTDDLKASGWRVTGPAEGDGGLTWLTVTKPFGTPDEANAALAEVTGTDGPLRDLQISRSTGFASSALSFTGTADLSSGLEAFGDAGLAQALDGESLGEDPAQIEARIGQPLSEAVRFDIVVDLAGGATRWSPRLGAGPQELDATSSTRDWPVLIFIALAVVLAAAAVAVTAVRLRGGPARSRSGAKAPAPALPLAPAAGPDGPPGANGGATASRPPPGGAGRDPGAGGGAGPRWLDRS